MKTITNFLLVLTLTASMAFADGHTGGGNRCETCAPPCTVGCGFAAPQTPGGEVSEVEELGSESKDEESVYEYWKGVLIEYFY